MSRILLFAEDSSLAERINSACERLGQPMEWVGKPADAIQSARGSQPVALVGQGSLSAEGVSVSALMTALRRHYLSAATPIMMLVPRHETMAAIEAFDPSGVDLIAADDLSPACLSELMHDVLRTRTFFEGPTGQAELFHAAGANDSTPWRIAL